MESWLTNCWYRCDNLAELELVQDSCLASGIKTNLGRNMRAVMRIDRQGTYHDNADGPIASDPVKELGNKKTHGELWSCSRWCDCCT